MRQWHPSALAPLTSKFQYCLWILEMSLFVENLLYTVYLKYHDNEIFVGIYLLLFIYFGLEGDGENYKDEIHGIGHITVLFILCILSLIYGNLDFISSIND